MILCRNLDPGFRYIHEGTRKNSQRRHCRRKKNSRDLHPQVTFEEIEQSWKQNLTSMWPVPNIFQAYFLVCWEKKIRLAMWKVLSMTSTSRTLQTKPGRCFQIWTKAMLFP